MFSARCIILCRFCSTQTSAASSRAAALWRTYEDSKTRLAEAIHQRAAVTTRITPLSVFANNELNLNEIQAYGFDYDYTLAVYTKAVNHLIYQLGLDRLVDFYRYPEEIKHMDYDPVFAIRGLHYDVNRVNDLIYQLGLDRLVDFYLYPEEIKHMDYDPVFAVKGLHYDVNRGLVMKLDAYCQIQLGTVYRGKKPVSDTEVAHLYKGTYIAADPVDKTMKQLLDLFSLPELGLLSNVTEYFVSNGIAYHPESLYQDVISSVRHVHVQGELYRSINADHERYVHPLPLLREFLTNLDSKGKYVFLLTNSPLDFVSRGMSYLIGPDWTNLFDFIVTSARKPQFFDDSRRPFRRVNKDDRSLSWEPVRILKRGEVYAGGNIVDFLILSGLDRQKVLYFGDHLYSDLAEPILRKGWRTAAVVPELKRDVEVQISPEFARFMYWLTALNNLIDDYQDEGYDNPECAEVLETWQAERRDLRRRAKAAFNPNFGSMFRTHNAASYFTRRLVRLADVYTSSVTNFLSYSHRHRFYPRRSSLPHELEWKALLED